MKGYFGKYGGAYVSDEVKKALNELEEAFEKAIEDKEFMREYYYYLKDYSGRETPLYFAENLTKFCGGAKVYLKREDLNHTGAHKINNVLGQILLAKRMGKNKVIAETGAGQHGVATATLAAKFGMECEIVMGEEDIKRQELNVFRMKILGAKVTPATSGTKTLNDAVNEALEKWVKNISDTFYVLGSAVGPHPYPRIVKEFQKIIGEEARKQILEKENKLPNYIVACVGGGSNAIGIFTAFLEDKDVNLIGVEAAGYGIETEMHAATITKGNESIIHGMNTIVLKDDNGDVREAYSISPGLDYPGVGPEHAFLSEIGRASYKYITDNEAIDGFMTLSRLEGIIPAIESAHAIAYAIKLAKTLEQSEVMIVNLSGRGDKDVSTISKLLN